MFRLNFTRRVLGREAAEKLLKHEVTQTLRSSSNDIVWSLLHGQLKIGDYMEVALDGRLIGHAYPALIDRLAWEKADLDDATRGGFTSIEDLQSALVRAGFRFKPIGDYLLYRVLFTWLPIS